MDKYEITYGLSATGVLTGGANLSATDFFGIPLKLQTKGGSQPTTLTWNYNGAVNTASIFQTLGALQNFQTDTVSDTLGAIVANGANGVTINTPSGSMAGVVRVIAPSSTNGNQTPYPSFTNYLSTIQTGGISATIAGQNGQYPKGGPFQNYNLSGVISNTTQTVNAMTVHPGDLVLNGTVQLGAVTTPLTILVTKANLSSFAIYGANPAYTICAACSDANKVVEKVVADYFSGLNFGLIGSHAPNPNAPGQTIGNSPSWTWYGNKPNGGGPTPLPLSDAYAAAQPGNPDYYNSYAAYLNNSSAPVTDAYGFPYTDRLASPLAALDDNTILTMTILPDEVRVASVGLGHHGPHHRIRKRFRTCSSALTRPPCSRSPAAERRFSPRKTPIRAARRSPTARPLQVTNSNPGVSSSIGTGLLTLDNGILEAGANDLVFNNAGNADEQRRDLRLERLYADLDRRHFRRGRTGQGRRRDPDPGHHQHLCRRHPPRRRHARDRRERRARLGRRHHAAQHDAAVRGERDRARERDRAERQSHLRYRIEHGRNLGGHLGLGLAQQDRLGNA